MFALMVSPALAAADPLETHATVHTLDNGLVVLVEESHRTDTVALHLAYGVGSRDEGPGLFGCAHLFEHLMFEGSKNVPTDAFDEWLTAAGGWNNAYTTNDVTAYHMAFPSGALDLALFLESDRMGFLDAGLDEGNVANQQSVVLQERDQGYDQPHGRDWDAMFQLLYALDHPYHHSTIGTVADVQGFDAVRVRDFWDHHYRSRNAVLGLVGNVDTEQAVEAVDFWFSDVPDRGEGPGRVAASQVPPRRSSGVIEDDVEDLTILVAWPAAPLNHPDEPALDLLSYVLSFGRGTRIDDRLYFDSSMTTDAGADYIAGDVSGQFVVYATSPKVSLKKLDRVVAKELSRLSAEPPTAAEMDRALKGWRTGWLDGLEQPVARAETLVDCFRATGDPNCLPALYAARAKVTPADVVRVAEAYLKDEVRTTLSVVPRGQTGKALPGSVAVELP